MVDVVRTPPGPPLRCLTLPRGGGWLFAETSGETAAEAVDAARKLAADAACLDSAVFTGPQAAALWRIREDGRRARRAALPAGAPAWPRLGRLRRTARVARPLPSANLPT